MGRSGVGKGEGRDKGREGSERAPRGSFFDAGYALDDPPGGKGTGPQPVAGRTMGGSQSGRGGGESRKEVGDLERILREDNCEPLIEELREADVSGVDRVGNAT